MEYQLIIGQITYQYTRESDNITTILIKLQKTHYHSQPYN